eukprot:333937_1
MEKIEEEKKERKKKEKEGKRNNNNNNKNDKIEDKTQPQNNNNSSDNWFIAPNYEDGWIIKASGETIGAYKYYTAKSINGEKYSYPHFGIHGKCTPPIKLTQGIRLGTNNNQIKGIQCKLHISEVPEWKNILNTILQQKNCSINGQKWMG